MELHTFSQKMNRLEEIVKQLDSPDIELEQGLALLEEGVGLHKDCQALLTKSQAKITTLLKDDQVAGSTVDQNSETSVVNEVNQDELPF